MLVFTGFYAFLFMSTRRWRNRSLPWRRIYTTPLSLKFIYLFILFYLPDLCPKTPRTTEQINKAK